MKTILKYAGVGIIYLLLQFNTLIYSQYYYSDGRQIQLSIDSSKVSIKFEDIFSQNDQMALLAQLQRIEYILPDQETIDDFLVCSLIETIGYDAFIDSLEIVDGIESAEPYYVYSGSQPSPVGETFFAAFDPGLSTTEIDDIIISYNVDIVEKIYGTESIYLLRKLPISAERLINVANAFYERDDVLFAHPNFGIKCEPYNYKLYDYYHPQQGHIKKVVGDFNQLTVWDFAGMENPVNVAVIDDGIAPHEDLPEARILPGYDFVDNDSEPIPYGTAHGLGCAGIIGASHTTNSAYEGIWSPWNGIISLNSNCQIVPIKIFQDEGATYLTIANGLSFAFENGAEVLSCSWGNPFGLNVDLIDSLIRQIYFDGRNGKGAPIVFSSGNSATKYPPGYCFVGYPARNPYTLAVGATEMDDERWYYSQYGPELDVVAPSGDVCMQGNVWSLDGMSYEGYNPYVDYIPLCQASVSWNCPMFQNNDDDYNCHFGGTSAAAPIVAGIASLLIARDSTLTAPEIYEVIRFSAETNLDFGQITVPHTELGYGRADAYRAMLAIVRGDANNDGRINIGDPVYLVNHIFKEGPPAQPDFRVGDANCDGSINIGDVTYLIQYTMGTGPEPPLCYEYEY